MLYRLDLFDPDSGATIFDSEVARGFLARHMTTARREAIQRAAESGHPIMVTRIGKAGALKPSLVVHPDGRCERPPGTKGDDCKRGSGQTCFCPNCRAERRAT